MKNDINLAQIIFMNKKEIGKKIAEHVKTNKLSKYKIVNSTGLKYVTMQDIEQGQTNYTINSLLEYLAAINLKVDIKPV